LKEKGNILSESYPVKSRIRESYHAEETLIRTLYKNPTIQLQLNKNKKYGKKLDPITILVVRKNKLGKLMSSRPCRDCIVKLMKSRLNITGVYYSTKDGTIEYELLNDMLYSPLTTITAGNMKNYIIRNKGQIPKSLLNFSYVQYTYN